MTNRTRINAKRPGHGARAVFLCLVLALAVIAPGAARAQMLHLDPIPWTAVADSNAGPALLVEATRFEESKFDWAADRLQLTLLLPAGDNGEYFVRIPHYTIDFGRTSLAARWPWIEGEEEATAAIDTFWTERRVSSFGQIEAGMNRVSEWPFLGRMHYGGAVGLPVGTDRLYPFSSVSFPLRAQARKVLEMRPGRLLTIEGGWLYNIDSGGEKLDETAFPNGWHGGLALHLGDPRGRHLVVDYRHDDRDGHVSQTAGLQIRLPWIADGSWGARLERELAGSLDRSSEWRLTLVWRIDASRPQTKPADGPGAAAVPDAGPGSESESESAIDPEADAGPAPGTESDSEPETEADPPADPETGSAKHS